MLEHQRNILFRAVLSGFVVLALGLLISSPAAARNKHTVGATEVIRVVDANLDFVARIDTGARTTSINAQNIEIENPANNKRDNLGKTITLDVVNAKGEKHRLKSKIVKVLEVRNAHGTELRYMIPLTLRWHGIDKLVNVNLRDRSAMTYKLLIGRDWLKGDFIVDVEKNPGGRR